MGLQNEGLTKMWKRKQVNSCVVCVVWVVWLRLGFKGLVMFSTLFVRVTSQ